MIFSSIISILFVFLAEALLPPLESNFTKTQQAIQLQLKRRNQVREQVFRGVTLKSSYNELGWADKPRNYETGKGQIVFIGDSFLEVRSSRNLATLTEGFLKSKGSEYEIINLSKDDIGVEQYRYIFQEFALELAPDHVFIFVYEGNDLFTRYTYTPYEHSPFFITKKSLAVLQEMDFSSTTKTTLLNWKQNQKVFKNKAELFKRLQDMELSFQQKNLMYLACYGYSSDYDGVPLIPKVYALLIKMAGKFIDYVGGYWNPDISQNSRPDILTLYPQYKKIFDGPKEKRLEAIAKFFSQKYLLLHDYFHCLALLENQEQRFISDLTEEADMPFYLFEALEKALKGTILRQPMASEANLLREETTDEYMKLFNEILKTANSKGISVTIVLIPEASYADEEFYRFWLPILDFRKDFLELHTLYLSLKRKLSENVSVIDLGEYSHYFGDSYWKFDGHWNEKGNQQVAEIIAEYILNHERDLK